MRGFKSICLLLVMIMCACGNANSSASKNSDSNIVDAVTKDDAVEQVVEITKRGRSTKWEQLKFAIIGMGLIGGSYAKALRNLGVKNIIAVEIDKEVCLQVQRLGLANLVLNEPTEALREADVIICAVYPEGVLDFCFCKEFSFFGNCSF